MRSKRSRAAGPELARRMLRHLPARRPACRITTVTALLLLSAVTTVGCAGQRGAAPSTERITPVDADTAQRTRIDIVDETTGALGGEGATRTFPDYVESCQLTSDEEGARWVYRVARSESGDAQADPVAASDIWRPAGMRVDRLVDAKGPAMVARGGDRVSLCFPGDADRITEQQADE